jgi:phage shock protein PspC (stress-responsive transcriptional regulator)
MLLIAIFSINGVSLMRDIFDLSFVFTSVLVLAGVEIIYLILFLFSKNRSSEKIAGLAHQFNLPLALVVVLAFIIMQSTMIFNPYSVSFPFWVIEDSLIIFKFGADIFYSIKLIG